MKAVSYDKFGDESVLQVREVPTPLPAANEVQVAVKIAGLNPVDYKLRQGMLKFLMIPKRPAITGKDFSGVISAVGANVSHFNIGDRVMGSVDPMKGRGSCAEFVCLDTKLIAKSPSGVSNEIAAALPVSSGTALQALFSMAHISKGQRILISGASGSVGATAVQLAKHTGAFAVGFCSKANMEYVKSIGCNEVYDYKEINWAHLNQKFDVIFDAAGVGTFSALRKQLNETGFYMSPVPTAQMFVHSAISNLISKQQSVPVMLKTDAHLLQELLRLADENVVVPRIAKMVGLDGVAAAQKEMASGKVAGKVCVRVAQ
jgi:NADPH:quinone reductase-like Zn-dependent oxidoreductase